MSFNNLLNFLRKLDKNTISYSISNPRENSIMVNVFIPGQIWEIEFMEDGTMEIEKYISNGEIYGAQEIDVLIRDFSD